MTNIEKTCLHHVLKAEETSSSSTARTCAIVIQGPRRAATPYAIKTYLTHNDDSVIVIVSTYLPENEMNGQLPVGTHLTENERESIKTGRLVYLFVKPPSPQEEPDFYKYNTVQNHSLHILSSFVGVRYALELGIPNCLKVRSDVLLGRTNLCKKLEEQKKSYPPPFQREDDRPNVTERILFCTYLTRIEFLKGEDHVCDFWYYGRTVDIHRIFDIGINSFWQNGMGMHIESGLSAECSIMRMWKKAIGLSSRTMTTMELAARYMIAITPTFVQMMWYKTNPDFSAYEREGEKFTFAVFEPHIHVSIQFSDWDNKFQELAKDLGWIGYPLLINSGR